MTAPPPLLHVERLDVGARDGQVVRPLLRGIDLTLAQGEAIGIVGESGAGKSTLALALLGSLRDGCVHTGGRVLLDGVDLLSATPAALRRLRGRSIALVPQDAGQSLTPTMRVMALLREALGPRAGTNPRVRARALLETVQLPDATRLLNRYPHQLSGGQQQRVAIALALAGEPRVLLLDEPTTGLDVTTQARLLTMLRELRRRTGVAMIMVSHDFGAVSAIADRVLVLYAGQAVEAGPADRVLATPGHPYTTALLAAVPRLDSRGLPRALQGVAPRAGFPPAGCAFRARCPAASERCAADPPVVPAAPGWQIRCHHADTTGNVPAALTERSDSPGRTMRGAPPLLEVRGLAVSYRQRDLAATLMRRPGPPPVVEAINVDVARGETVALIGESGSGKSTIVRAIAGLLPATAGSVLLDRQPLAGVAVARTLEQRRRIQLIFQNPDASLNPRQTVRQALAQPLRLYEPGPAAAHEARSRELLELVRLSPALLDRYPAHLSGGEKQRVAIARAFAARPDLLLCDEITSSLDVSVQAAVLDLLATLQREHGVATLFVAHDLAVVRAISDRVVVLDRGRMCEAGPVAAVFASPHHPCTAGLLAAIPEPGRLAATPPDLPAERLSELEAARGCPFRDRCPLSQGDACANAPPPIHLLPTGKRIACRAPLDQLERIAGPSAPAHSTMEPAR